MTGQRATHEELQELLHLVTQTLIDRIKQAPTADLLGVARGLLKNSGTFGLALEPEQQQRLQQLWDLLLLRLLEAMQQPQPPAAILSEVRQLLADNGITKDLPAGLAQAEALQVLHGIDLPFQ